MSVMYQWQMTAQDADFALVETTLPQPAEGEVLVRVAGCGVCHTDISFWHHGVRTRRDLPLTLGHEISGTVVDGPADLIGRNVIIPAVIPCGECKWCRKGRGNVCRKQIMPGNDIHGGFASHILVPARFLCHVPESVIQKYGLETVSVIADAVSTPYQVMKRADLDDGDCAIVIGVGGVGLYGALLARIFGARVIAIDISDEKLATAASHGVDATINSRGLAIPDVKNRVKEEVKRLGLDSMGWKIFEMSGTAAGQELAFALITHASVMSVVGFTMDKLEVRLSNLMAFDARIIGTWGCLPELYPEVVALLESGALDISNFTETIPMSQINDVFRNTLQHKYTKRSVLVPDFN